MPKSRRLPFYRTLRWKFASVVSSIVVLMGLLTIFLVSSMNRSLREEHLKKGCAVAVHLASAAAEPLLVENRVRLTSLLESAVAEDRELVYALILTPRGEVSAHTFPGDVPPDLLRALAGGPSGPRRFSTEKGLVADVAAPILRGEIGVLHLGLSEELIAGQIADTRKDLLLVTLLFLAFGLLLSRSLGLHITRPLEELADAAEDIGAGDLERRSRVGPRDEIGLLSSTFNRMADDLQTHLRERRRAEESLRRAHDELELRVRERTVELAAANRELESFSYSVSHDLRAPLRGIDGFSLALLEEYEQVLDETGRDYLQRIRLGCVRMGQLIDDLLQLSRLTRSEMRRQRFSLSELVLEIVAELRASHPEPTTTVSVAAGVEVVADRSLLRAAMTNLLQNAWKFSRRATRPQIEFGTVDSAGVPVYFVRDNGVGFDMQYADKLFGAFQRLHGSDEFEGTGIGLATVQRVVRRHGGRIWAEGEVGRGATFYFCLEGEGS